MERGNENAVTNQQVENEMDDVLKKFEQLSMEEPRSPEQQLWAALLPLHNILAELQASQTTLREKNDKILAEFQASRKLLTERINKVEVSMNRIVMTNQETRSSTNPILPSVENNQTREEEMRRLMNDRIVEMQQQENPGPVRVENRQISGRSRKEMDRPTDNPRPLKRVKLTMDDDDNMEDDVVLLTPLPQTPPIENRRGGQSRKEIERTENPRPLKKLKLMVDHENGMQDESKREFEVCLSLFGRSLELLHRLAARF